MKHHPGDDHGMPYLSNYKVILSVCYCRYDTFMYTWNYSAVTMGHFERSDPSTTRRRFADYLLSTLGRVSSLFLSSIIRYCNPVLVPICSVQQ